MAVREQGDAAREPKETVLVGRSGRQQCFLNQAKVKTATKGRRRQGWGALGLSRGPLE